ncbi:hypothetical protein QNI16_20420 [Cytophagaceae bacterium YF14B1]|uniref:Uncharacterized protein n=1 Tax=Xanthocytophaga flava TaxID=3048013 RepID=A0AAE3QT25_9BACT|nr:hypothetical protein [Xanthocytophaga flavus]MDJ1482878.1 hypothetical protein [Xanthocytophaga flavus]
MISVFKQLRPQMYHFLIEGLLFNDSDSYHIIWDDSDSTETRWYYALTSFFVIPYCGLGLIYILKKQVIWKWWIIYTSLLFIGYWLGMLIRIGLLRLTFMTYTRQPDPKYFYKYWIRYFHLEEWGIGGVLSMIVLIVAINKIKTFNKNRMLNY